MAFLTFCSAPNVTGEPKSLGTISVGEQQLASTGRAAMKSDRRHQLQENTLAHWMAPKVEAARPYGMLIVGVVVAIIAIVVIILVIQNSQTSAEEEAWARIMRLTSNEYFFQQQQLEAEKHPNQNLTAAEISQLSDRIEAEVKAAVESAPDSTAALRGKLFLADRARTRGTSALFTDPQAAGGQLDEAIELYDEISKTAEDDWLRDRANFFLAETLIARAGEADIQQAKDIYKNLSESGPYTESAKAQLQTLKGSFAWFRSELDRAASRPNAGTSTGGSNPFNTPGPVSNQPSDLPGGSASDLLDKLAPPLPPTNSGSGTGASGNGNSPPLGSGS